MNNHSIVWTYDIDREWNELRNPEKIRPNDIHASLRNSGFIQLYQTDNGSKDANSQLRVWRHNPAELVPEFYLESRGRQVPIDFAITLHTDEFMIALIYVRDFPSLLRLMQDFVAFEQLGMLSSLRDAARVTHPILRDIRDKAGQIFVTGERQG